MILKFKNSGQFKKRSIPHNKGKKTGFNQKQSVSLKKRYANDLGKTMNELLNDWIKSQSEFHDECMQDPEFRKEITVESV